MTSSVLKWPARDEVDRAVRAWVKSEAEKHPDLVKIGYFGSYARGDAGVGSDLDLIAIVRKTEIPYERRAVAWDLSTLPVPAELIVYTEMEFARILNQDSRFSAMLQSETVWIDPPSANQ